MKIINKRQLLIIKNQIYKLMVGKGEILGRRLLPLQKMSRLEQTEMMLRMIGKMLLTYLSKNQILKKSESK